MAATDIERSEVTTSHQVAVERVRLPEGASLPWQRSQVSDRVFVITGGEGSLRVGYDRYAPPEEVGPGDAVLVRRLKWHRLAAAPGQPLEATVVTVQPAEVEEES